MLNRYVSQLLRTTRLDNLLMKHIEMSSEIKSLNSDMQMLVYENYNKFISATDTIRSMKSNVDGMDSNMHQLQTIIGTARPLDIQIVQEGYSPVFFFIKHQRCSSVMCLLSHQFCTNTNAFDFFVLFPSMQRKWQIAAQR